MGESTKIEWTNHTFNPWWGCVRVSPGCGGARGIGGCYAEAFAHRLGLKIWGAGSARRFFGDKHWSEPLRWNRTAAKAAVRRTVFCASMGDVCEDREDLIKPRARLSDLIVATPHLIWLLLTKRPENFARLFPAGILDRCWAGTTAETQEYYDDRWLVLSRVRAAERFISYEPALGPLTIKCAGCGHDVGAHLAPDRGGCSGLFPSWVIAGAESGRGARSMSEEWVRSVRDDCTRAGISFFYKQKIDDEGRKVSLPVLDGRTWSETPKV